MEFWLCSETVSTPWGSDQTDLNEMWDEVIEALLRALQAWAAAKELATENGKKQEECNDWYAEESSLNAMVDNEYSEEWQWEYT